MEVEADVACDPIVSSSSFKRDMPDPTKVPQKPQRGIRPTRALYTGAEIENSQDQDTICCIICKEEHNSK